MHVPKIRKNKHLCRYYGTYWTRHQPMRRANNNNSSKHSKKKLSIKSTRYRSRSLPKTEKKSKCTVSLFWTRWTSLSVPWASFWFWHALELVKVDQSANCQEERGKRNNRSLVPRAPAPVQSFSNKQDF